MTQFYNKNMNVIIFGSNGRIGKMISELFVNDGVTIIGVDNKPNLIDQKKYKNFFYIKSDISKEKNLATIFNNCKKKFKKIDAVINCSYPKSKKFGKNLHNLDEEYLKKDLYNLLGIPIIIAKVSISFFLKQKYGNLIFLSSIQGVASPKFEHYKKTSMVSPIEYTASKAGVISLTKYLAKFYKNNNIRVNCISPGGISDNQPEIFKKKYRNSCSNYGLLKPEDVYETFKFILSKGSKYVNGQNIIIDDGWSL